MSIGHKLNLTHGLMAVSVLVLILGANVVVNTMQRDFASLTEQTLKVTAELEDLRAAGQRIVASTAEYALLSMYESVGEPTARKEEIALIDQGIELYQSAFGRYSQNINWSFPDETSYRDDIGDAGVALIAGSRFLVDLSRKNAPLALLAEQKEAFEALERSYLATVMAALAHEREELEEREETILEGMTTARTWAWAGFSVVAVAIMLFGYLVARSITGPLHELTEATKRFGAGDYSARVDPESRDELGQLATAFNDMIKSQRHADEALREAHEQLEARVQERTQELRTVNETLNAQEKELRKNAENLRRLTGKLIVAQENERRRIGRELHDDLTQNLAAMAIDAGRLEQQAEATEDRDEDGLCKIKERLIELSEYVLTLSRQLDPTIVEELGIAAALHSLCEELEQNEGVQIDYEADAIPADIPNDQALCIYRVAQEALRNIIKHSRATRAQVHLRLKKGTLQFQVKDNGIGFNPDEERNQIGSGLASIEERVWFAGGTVQVETGPGDGTVISVSIPLT